MFRRIRTIVPTLVAVLVLTTAGGSALAAPKGAGGAGGGSHTSASLTFSSSSVQVGDTYQVVGSGFAPGVWVAVGARYPGATMWASGRTDASGNFVFTFTAESAGQISHEASEQTRNGSLRLRASATLTVG